MAELFLLGIRHHGAGSAHRVLTALEQIKPDCLLIEGADEGNRIISLLGEAEMRPPVALLLYPPDRPYDGSTHPYAIFSPEYQAICWALRHQIPVSYSDLPLGVRLAAGVPVTMPPSPILYQLARLGGADDVNGWWEGVIEQRRGEEHDGGVGLFRAIVAMMAVVREEGELDRFNALREAWMRREIGRQVRAGAKKIAFVCGAWHTPALQLWREKSAEDTQLLAQLPPAHPVEAAWTPWNYGRLAQKSGYGAGLFAPNWSHHLWEMGLQGASPRTVVVRWLAKVGEQLRTIGRESSPAHQIDIVRLAESLAILRGLPHPRLEEISQAIQTVLGEGHGELLAHLEKTLWIGERMGSLPADTPQTPLQRDVREQQASLALWPSADLTTLTLDLRNERDVGRSHLLHRLTLLGIKWGKNVPQRQTAGTFREVWRVQWSPNLEIELIEAGMWGNTVAEASAEKSADFAQKATTLAELTELLESALLAALPRVSEAILARLQDVAAVSHDLPPLIDALPHLVRLARYGSARPVDGALLDRVLQGVLTRITIGLPFALQGLAVESADAWAGRLATLQQLIRTLDDADYRAMWHKTLTQLNEQEEVPSLLKGCIARLSWEERVWSPTTLRESVQSQLHNPIAPPLARAQWLEGLLRDGGVTLVHDLGLWQGLDGWVTGLSEAQFMQVVPILRRTFAGFSQALRQQLREKVRGTVGVARVEPQFDRESAEKITPFVQLWLGLH